MKSVKDRLQEMDNEMTRHLLEKYLKNHRLGDPSGMLAFAEEHLKNRPCCDEDPFKELIDES